jgi:hypothetical protein
MIRILAHYVFKSVKFSIYGLSHFYGISVQIKILQVASEISKFVLDKLCKIYQMYMD